MSSTEYGPFLPHELLREVLSFLPVKSLMRFRCVCKSWNFLVFNHAFVKLHLQRSSPSILCNVEDFINVEPPRPQKYLQCYSIESLLKDPSSTLHDFAIPIPYSNFIIGVCNGLVCLISTTTTSVPLKGRLTHVWIQCWNPATRLISQKLHFHSELSVDNYSYMGFGYDNSRDIYKVVAVLPNMNRIETQVRVQCLGENCSRKVVSLSGLTHLSGKGHYLHGTLNWVARLVPGLDGYNQHVIYSFDLRDETYKYLLLPSDESFLSPKGQNYPVCLLGLLRGCLSLSYYDKETYRLNVWQMKEFGVAESWSQLFNVCCHSFQPLCMSHNGNFLLTNMGCFRLFMYNRRQNTIDLVRKYAARVSLCGFFQYYVQSLVLPY